MPAEGVAGEAARDSCSAPVAEALEAAGRPARAEEVVVEEECLEEGGEDWAVKR